MGVCLRIILFGVVKGVLNMQIHSDSITPCRSTTFLFQRGLIARYAVFAMQI
jgi:hypothetical protein